MPTGYDFSGYATRNDIKCMDGRTIRQDAFKDCDGLTVPLVWQHQHDDPGKVLGHALLENRKDGVYTYGYFNNSEGGKTAKTLVDNGDVKSLSIYANQLKEKAGNVFHGVIREVSLVLAGANPGAYIDNLSFEHGDGDDYEDGDAIISFGEDIELSHAAEDSTPKEEPKTDTKEGETKVAEKEKTVKDVFDSMSEEQKNVVYFMIGEALKNQNGSDDDEGDDDVKHNVFENETKNNFLSHADQEMILADAKKMGSFQKALQHYQEENGGVLIHADGDTQPGPYDVWGRDATLGEYGITNIDYLFPDAKAINNTPDFIKREDAWVTTVMNGVRHTPFARVKSIHANITMDEARAKGYLKGNPKAEEVFSLLKRSTDPQTIYKKQKLDRDDVIDITDFDVVAWLRNEMRGMLNEEAARAILVGDGRLSTDDDKIFPDHIRPIWGDDPLYTIPVNVTPGADDEKTIKSMIKSIIKARKNYKGSGNLTMFTTEDMLSDMLLLEDGIGHPLYADEAALARKLRVGRIVTVPVMDNLTDASGNKLAAIIVDLKDYNVGTNKGGEVNMFDDFDIDYNQMKYLIETRFSGALVKPYSAMAVLIGEADENP